MHKIKKRNNQKKICSITLYFSHFVCLTFQLWPPGHNIPKLKVSNIKMTLEWSPLPWLFILVAPCLSGMHLYQHLITWLMPHLSHIVSKQGQDSRSQSKLLPVETDKIYMISCSQFWLDIPRRRHHVLSDLDN